MVIFDPLIKKHVYIDICFVNHINVSYSWMNGIKYFSVDIHLKEMRISGEIIQKDTCIFQT